MREITHDELRDLISYEPRTGAMTWLRARGRCAAGYVAGYDADRGYRGVRILGRCYYVHRLAFLYMNGRHPTVIDHINGVRNDNRWTNLREVTNAENSRNMAIPITNKSGVIGVFWNRSRNVWTARIKVNQKNHSLGDFDRLEDAANARTAAERKYGFHKNHGRRGVMLEFPKPKDKAA